MAIATLTTVSARHFAGNAHLAESDSDGLAAILIAGQEKINEIISGLSDGSLDSLRVGDGTQGEYYGGSSDSYFEVDGVNPPRLTKLQLLDQTNGAWVTLTISNGVINVDGTPIS